MTSEAKSARMKRAALYFACPAYRRMLKAVWSKYGSLGRIGGKAAVQNVSAEESEAINLFFGWNCKPGDTVSIPLALFEAELRESAFAIGLNELHLLLEGVPLSSKGEQRLAKDEDWRRFMQSVRDNQSATLTPVAADWLSRLETGVGAGYRTLQELYKASLEQALLTVGIVLRALDVLFSDDGCATESAIRLPVLAARVSGDAHALDSGQPAGRMLLAILRERLSDGMEEIVGSWEEAVAGEDGSATLKLRETYRSFGILDDDLSSTICWFVPEPGQGRTPLPCIWTLRQVEAADRLPRCSRLYIVENPAVFSTILDRTAAGTPFTLDRNPPALICTSGPASAAAIRWIQRCLDASGKDCLLYYSGDFDLKGLSMGLTLSALFPGRFASWRFGSDAYQLAACSTPGPKLYDVELDRLASMKVGWDPSLCDNMRQFGRKVHQEAFVELLARDFIGWLHR